MRKMWCAELIILVLFLACFLPSSAEESNGGALFGRLIKESSTTLIEKGRNYGFKKHELDSALVCFSIVANRYNKDMSKEEKVQCIEAYNLMYYAYNLSSFDYPRSYECLTKASKIANENDIKVPLLYANLGLMYQGAAIQTGEHRLDSLAYSKFVKTFELALEQKDNATLDIAFSNILQEAPTVGTWNEMASFYQKYKKHSRNDTFYRYNLLMYEAMNALNDHNKTKAIGYYEKQLEIAQDTRGNSRLRFSSYFSLAPLYLQFGKKKEARECYNHMYDIATRYKLQDLLPVAYEGYVSYFDAVGDKEQSVAYRIKNIEVKDSLLNYKLQSNVASMRSLGELNDIREEMNAVQHRHQLQRLCLCLAIVIILTISVFIFILNRKNRQLRLRNESLYQRWLETVAREERNRKQRELYENEIRHLREQKDATEQTKYQNSHINDITKETLLMSILKYMDNNQEIYSVDFSLEKLAEDIGSKPKYVSQIINEHFGNNFNAFLNEYRIKEACRRFNDSSRYGNYTIAAISESVGFKSRSHFATIFRKIVGLNPSEYLLQAQKEVES